MIDHSKGCANCRHTEATLRRPFVPPDRIPVLVDSHGAAGHTGRSDPGSPDIQAMSIFPADRPLTDDEPKLARWNLPARRKPTIAYRRCLLWFGVSRLPASMCYRSVAIFSFSFFSLFFLWCLPVVSSVGITRGWFHPLFDRQNERNRSISHDEGRRLLLVVSRNAKREENVEIFRGERRSEASTH